MMEPVSDRRPPITPQLALRVAIFGGFAFALFAIVFFRLWYLQVLSGDQYLAQANSNRVRVLPIPAPRGKIVDRNDKVIVENTFAAVLEIDPASLPQQERDLAAQWGSDEGRRDAKPEGHKGEPIPIPGIPTAALRARYQRLARVLDTSANQIHREVVHSLVLVPYSAVRLKTGIPRSILAYVRERPELFPGVKVSQTYVRKYPQGTLAAQLLGPVGAMTKFEAKEPRYHGLPTDASVGHNGVERAYDKYLRGKDGIQRVQVDANGRPVANSTLKNTPPAAGDRVRLSLDLGLEDAAQKAIEGPLNPGSHAGAVVALDPRSGEVLAMDSFPTFDPSIFTKQLTDARYKALTGTGKEAGPLFNRAISSAYPVGSTFKPITALAGLDAHLVTPATTVDDTGCTQVGEIKRCNAKHEQYGTIDMVKAIQVSSDVYFYKLGILEYYHGGLILQKWARKLGLGRDTGIDLPNEYAGLIPDPAWRKRLANAELACRAKRHIPADAPAAQGCGISDLRQYNLGDTVNLAIGQGDLQATPLQMAVVYSALENGGTIVTPHLGLDVESPSAELIQHLQSDPARHVAIDPADLAVVRDGLHLGASTPEGTSGDVFGTWWDQSKYPVYGKTGTATRLGRPNDQSWYAAYVPDAKRPIVVVVTVEDAGFGAAVAAPIACKVLAEYYKQDGSKCSPGSATAL
ncbi:MAG TPA: penicillin-binding transpeptidase domain-containing protein [Solirubrobacteraceae bacterium]|jgi:penicillin-binding protein 2|nr:penicillin-binding transpeptidase domain-containing protein [Solirubrobacteraceae bacterium]